MLERKATTLNISVGNKRNKSFMGDNTIIDLDISTHLVRELGNGIISSSSQHLTLAEAKELVAHLNLVIAEVELEVLENGI
jgi:hypothetical protein